MLPPQFQVPGQVTSDRCLLFQLLEYSSGTVSTAGVTVLFQLLVYSSGG
jgi:hypothetical protein